MEESRGYVQLYTGDGRGKTSAAFGLALRALGAGLKVYIGQFIKGMKYHETHLQQLYSKEVLTIEQLGSGCFIEQAPKTTDILMAQSALQHVGKIMADGAYDLVILDELTIALYYGLVTVEAMLAALQDRAPNVEIIITGRYAPPELIQYADLVTEMVDVKHYYTTNGTLSRSGFDW